MATTGFAFDARAAGTLLTAWLRLGSFLPLLRHLRLLRPQDVLHEQVLHLLDCGRRRSGFVFSVLEWWATLRGLTSVMSGMGRVPDVGRRAGIAVKVAGMRKGPTFMGLGLLDLSGRLPTLPHTCACSTIGAEGLNFRVRDGNGWDPLAMVTQHLLSARLLGHQRQELLSSLTLNI